MRFQYNDGGREAAGYKAKSVGDCVTRAIAIATGLPYQEIYDTFNEMGKSERRGSRKRGKSSARSGVYKPTIKTYLAKLGWTWTPTMFIGSGCKVHVKEDEIPSGTVILSLSKHLTCAVNGVINDTYDCTRDETRCVYGYWTKGLTAA